MSRAASPPRLTGRTPMRLTPYYLLVAAGLLGCSGAPQPEDDGGTPADAGCTTCMPPPSCNDGQRNGSETDVDCGGGACPACAAGRSCGASTDCASAYCAAGTCRQPTC